MLSELHPVSVFSRMYKVQSLNDLQIYSAMLIILLVSVSGRRGFMPGTFTTSRGTFISYLDHYTLQ